MSVWKNRNTWRYRIMRDGVPVGGSARTREEALALEARARSDLIAERIGATPRRSIEDAFAKYFSSPEALNLKSLASLVDKARQWQPHIAGRRLTDAPQVAETATAQWHSAGLKPATINRRLALLRRILNLAYRRWDWLREPLADKIQLLPGEESRHLYLTHQQATQLRRAIRPGPARAWITLLLATGLRASELEHLQPHQVRDGLILLTARNKGARPRAIPVLHFGHRYLHHLPLTLKYQGVRGHFERARQAIGMPHLRLHDLRHTTASWLIQDGQATLRDIQEWFGHSTPTMSARYTHLEAEHLKRIARKLRASTAETREKRRNIKAL